MDVISRARDILPIIFGSVLGANVLTMSVMNFFEIAARNIVLFYVVSLILLAIIFSICRVEYPTLTKREHLFSIAVAIVLFLIRIPYLFESLIGYSLIPLNDDPMHVPNLSSIIHTDRFPPRSMYDSSQFLGYYYAPWVPGAALYHAGLASTVKQALGLVKLLYSFFITYFAVYASKVLFSEPKHRVVFLVLCFLYGGFDFLYWVSQLNFVPSHSEWWALSLGFRLQFSNFVTLYMWPQNHLLGALAVLFGLYLLATSKKTLAHGLSGLIFLSGVFSSPYAAFGALPFIAWFILKRRKLQALPAAGLVFVLISLPLWWILIGNEHVKFRFFGALDESWLNHKTLAFVVFLFIVCLEFWPLLTAAILFARRQKDLHWPLVLSILFLLSTFFFFYHENYSIKSSMIPVWTLSWLATPYISAIYSSPRRKWLWLIAAVYLPGTLLEYASSTKMAIDSFKASREPFYAAALQSNLSSDRIVSSKLTSEAAKHDAGWIVLEKHKPVAKSDITIDEARLLHPDNRLRLTYAKVMGAFGTDGSR